jgi:hexosaminidase
MTTKPPRDFPTILRRIRASGAIACIALPAAAVSLSGPSPRAEPRPSIPAAMRRPSQQAVASAILPRPALERRIEGAAPFTLRSPVRIVVPRANPRLLELGQFLGEVLRVGSGFEVAVTSGDVDRPVSGSITLDTARTDSAFVGSASEERYAIDVSERGVEIRGASAAGVLWGIQSLRQLLPAAFESGAPARARTWEIPALTLRDAPGYSWRGSMLDVSRHFLPVAEVERHIDLLSRYKLNVLHWHLTDDQGWRVAIASRPRLTSVGGWRTEATGERTGGFYSAREIRRVVEYARMRGVMVVPEIEMPGHARAALAAYPELGCGGDSVAVATSWGVFADILCPASPATFPTLFAVLDEVMSLFPAPYVHVGGDEVPKDRWRDCAACQALMRREGLADEEALQGWFLRRIGRYLADHGRTLIAWDEALAGGLDRGSVVQSWRDTSHTRAAVAAGHRVIASPSEWVYLNRAADDLTLAQVNAFDPLPAGLSPSERALVVGSEATFWSEHITSGTNLDLMALPRLLAFADRLWGASPSDLAATTARIERDHRARLVAIGHAVGETDAPLPSIGVTYDSVVRQPRLRLTDMRPAFDVRGTTDGTQPTMQSRRFNDGELLRAMSTVRVQRFMSGATVGEERRFHVDRHLAVGKATTVNPAPSASYPGTGPWGLTDGLLGGAQHDDGSWVGSWGPDMEAVVDLGARIAESEVSICFLQNSRSWILLPRKVELAASNDGVRWSAPVTETIEVRASQDGLIVRCVAHEMPPARYVRVVARNAGRLPAGHPGAGEPSWLFADEIVVRRITPMRQR